MKLLIMKTIKDKKKTITISLATRHVKWLKREAKNKRFNCKVSKVLQHVLDTKMAAAKI